MPTIRLSRAFSASLALACARIHGFSGLFNQRHNTFCSAELEPPNTDYLPVHELLSYHRVARRIDNTDKRIVSAKLSSWLDRQHIVNTTDQFELTRLAQNSKRSCFSTALQHIPRNGESTGPVSAQGERECHW